MSPITRLSKKPQLNFLLSKKGCQSHHACSLSALCMFAVQGAEIGFITVGNFRKAFPQPHDRYSRGVRGKSYCYMKRAFLHPKPGERSPLCTPAAMYVRLENKSSDGLFQQGFFFLFFSQVEKSLLFASGNDLCKLNPLQKMNEAVKPEQYGSLSFYEKKKKK